VSNEGVEVEGLCEKGVKENIWTYEIGDDVRVFGLHTLYYLPNIVK
jgi:hypothetical protein